MITDPIKFVIALEQYHEEEVGDGEYIVIDAQESEEISAGFIVLNNTNDIFTLRDAIDAFIDKHQISRIINHE